MSCSSTFWGFGVWTWVLGRNLDRAGACPCTDPQEYLIVQGHSSDQKQAGAGPLQWTTPVRACPKSAPFTEKDCFTSFLPPLISTVKSSPLCSMILNTQIGKRKCAARINGDIDSNSTPLFVGYSFSCAVCHPVFYVSSNGLLSFIILYDLFLQWKPGGSF